MKKLLAATAAAISVLTIPVAAHAAGGASEPSGWVQTLCRNQAGTSFYLEYKKPIPHSCATGYFEQGFQNAPPSAGWPVVDDVYACVTATGQIYRFKTEDTSCAAGRTLWRFNGTPQGNGVYFCTTTDGVPVSFNGQGDVCPAGEEPFGLLNGN